MAVKSEVYIPNPLTGTQEIHHFETELEQIEDMTSFAQALNKKSDAASMRSHLEVPANSTATESAAGLMPAVDKVKVNNIVHSAEAHNGIFRGKDLTSYFASGQMSTDIANGKFDDIYIGDYITKTINLPAITYTDKAGVEQTQAAQTFNNVKWLVGAIDPHIHCGDTETTAHHVLLIPASTLQRNVKMNPTNDTTGAYTGSDMWRVHIPNWASAIKTAFGSSHVLKHRELLANAINATAPAGAGAGWLGTASGWAWTDVEVNIPNESMIYGHHWGSSGHEGGDFPRMLPLYALKCGHLDDRSWFWLRTVSSASVFALANGSGYACNRGASGAGGDGGIRPYFLFR